MYQKELFSGSFKDQRFLGSGVFGTVSAIGDSGWVFKYSDTQDGTLNYLEWCKREQAAGRGMRGMPEIDVLIHTEYGYVCTMRQYDEHYEDLWAIRELDYIEELIGAFERYMEDVFYYEDYADDLHEGNFMKSPEGFILTDPSCAAYQSSPQVAGFHLN